MFGNPYKYTGAGKRQTQQYSTFRYYTNRGFNYEKVIEICENRDYDNTCHYRSTSGQIKRIETTKKNWDTKEKIYRFEKLSVYPQYDDIGIIKSDNAYIYYRDKVWSIAQARYLIHKTNRKGTYCLLYSGLKNRNKYFLEKVAKPDISTISKKSNDQRYPSDDISITINNIKYDI